MKKTEPVHPYVKADAMVRSLTLFLLFLIVNSLAVSAQSLIPFLSKNGLYGYARPNGEVVTEPQFKLAYLPDSNGVVLAINGYDSLSVLDLNGNILLDAMHPFGVYDDSYLEEMTNIDGTKRDTIHSIKVIYSSDYTSFLLINHSDNKIKALKEFGCNRNTYNPYQEGDTPQFKAEKVNWF